MIKQEFDNYIKDYRTNLDQSLHLSGESSTYFAQYKAQKLAEWLPQLQNKSISILDFGCGDGVMTQFVNTCFPHAKLFGVDPSPESIKEAQESYKQITFSVNSDQDTILDFPDNYFDIVYAAGAFHHIPFNLHQGYCKELRRIIKPSGYLVIFELNPLNPLTVYTFKNNPIDQHAKMMWPWYTYKLTKRIGSRSIKFYCFYPKVASFLRPTERFMTKLPLSALYATITKKDN